MTKELLLRYREAVDWVERNYGDAIAEVRGINISVKVDDNKVIARARVRVMNADGETIVHEIKRGN
jgi:hypothetical protein